MRKSLFILFVLSGILSLKAQVNPAVAMSESMAYTARFNPSDRRQLEVIAKLDLNFLIGHLRTDPSKNAFWLNIYNSYMLLMLRDTVNEGVYTRFYKTRNLVIAGKSMSLSDIENEFLLPGAKRKKRRFHKPFLDTGWNKLKPTVVNPEVLFCMYRGLYGYPPFQSIENESVNQAYQNSLQHITFYQGAELCAFNWLQPYERKLKGLRNYLNSGKPVIFINTPFAVHIANFYPKYEGAKFKEEPEHPWLKK